MKYLIIAAILVSVAILTGCSVYKTAKDTTKFVADAKTLNDQITYVREDLAQYSDQPKEMYALEQWQLKLQEALKGEVNTEVAIDLATEGQRLYGLFYAEAKAKWDKADTAQRYELQDLNKQALKLYSGYTEFLNDPETFDIKKFLLDIGDLTYYGYKAYKAVEGM